MAKIELAIPFDAIRGKFSSNDKVVLRTRAGRTHSYIIKHPYKGPLAESRKQAIGAFSEAVKQCKTEMADPERLSYWQDRYAQYCKLANRHIGRANAKYLGTTSDKFYSTLRGFIIASISTQLRDVE